MRAASPPFPPAGRWPGLSGPLQHIERRYRLAAVQQVHTVHCSFDGDGIRAILTVTHCLAPCPSSTHSGALAGGAPPWASRDTAQPDWQTASPVALQFCSTLQAAPTERQARRSFSSSCSHAGFQKTMCCAASTAKALSTKRNRKSTSNGISIHPPVMLLVTRSSVPTGRIDWQAEGLGVWGTTNAALIQVNH